MYMWAMCVPVLSVSVCVCVYPAWQMFAFTCVVFMYGHAFCRYVLCICIVYVCVSP